MTPELNALRSVVLKVGVAQISTSASVMDVVGSVAWK